MAKNKTFKLAQTKELSNILEFPHEKKGKWAAHFGNDNPIVLELACGKGHYTIGLGQKYPAYNVIGIDLKGVRLWKGATDAIEGKLDNVCFARFAIEQIVDFFAENEVSEIWITFPDPQPKKERKRLTHPNFLRKYRQILKPDGFVHLKTDNTPLFEFTLGVLSAWDIKTEIQTRNLYHSAYYTDDLLQIKTHYELLFVNQGETIKYGKFKIDQVPLPKV